MWNKIIIFKSKDYIVQFLLYWDSKKTLFKLFKRIKYEKALNAKFYYS